ncbi:Protein translocase subunit SecY [Fusobacterium sp. DD29]|nr:Protein translocase subunit SecY [Fusobacterium sp. DD45]MBR8711383.1 Protein translocase subunit SecY [Fusobacterium sp. DD28]MBR8749691.1 Protein translocase subunit SecY [Fusobacterium sp. DD29]MBR8751932.1 Protein translocase subunit SecY [Fusobacterium sp. DD26]MBR8761952.1 Protein translocase subunit SecY [Fusobacterium sp. DD25]MBR8767970.1 Protein translocase subunit SecY [Fusobacterium sp. DD43]MBR8771993.1 Protein translocase subunit SecY [Fusobacterium sp. DD40]MBR8776276.1 Pro
MKIPELRERIVFTLLMFLVARVGTYIPAPGVDVDRLATMTAQSDILGYINMFSGGAFKRVSIFALGIVPYINSSIVFSLLAVIVPKIEEIQKEGESGRNKITQWTRYVTIAVAVVQSFGVCLWLQSVGLVTSPGTLFFLTTIVTLTAGTVFLMWIGEQISIKGIGNGVSLLIFLNVISGGPSNIVQTIQSMRGSKFLIPVLLLIGLAGILVVTGIVIFQLGERKIPIHYVGKGFSGRGGMGQNSYIPLKLNSAGVMPVIFASVVMMIPSALVNVIPSEYTIKTTLSMIFNQNHPVYMILYAIVIIFFSFFYTAIVFDPEKVADNLKQGGGTIPGIRPGTETVEYLEGVVTRITWGGAVFLAVISILPYAIFTSFGLPVFFGGTGIIIVVGVAIDTVQQINAHLVMREYKGFI